MAKNKNKFSYYVLLCTLISIFLAATFFIFNSKASEVNNVTNIRKINSNIEITNEKTGEHFKKNLPCKMPYGSYFYTFKANTISGEASEDLYIYIRSVYSKYTISSNNKIIYDYTPKDTKLVKSSGATIKIIKLPKELIGKELKVTFSPMIKGQYGVKISAIWLSSTNSILIDNSKNKLSLLIFSIILFVFSVQSFILVLYLIINKKGAFYYFYLSLFAFSTSLYLLADKPLAYVFFAGKGAFTYILEYSLFLFSPITCAMFLLDIYKREQGFTHAYKILKVFTLLMIINMFAQLTLTYYGKIEFIEMQKISQFLILMFLLFILTVPLIKDSSRFNNKIFKIIFVIVIIIFLLLLFDYFFTSQFRLLPSVGASVIIFLSLQVWLAVKYYILKYNDLFTTKLYKQLALKDTLTMLSNRSALEEDLKEIEKNTGELLLIMVLDINNLKNINDSLGHKIGDEIIKKAANIFINVENLYTNTKAYRMGGDEFIIMGHNINANLGEKIETYIQAELEKNYPLSLAIGYGTKEINHNFNRIEFLEEIDKKMYKNKKEQKSKTI